MTEKSLFQSVKGTVFPENGFSNSEKWFVFSVKKSSYWQVLYVREIAAISASNLLLVHAPQATSAKTYFLFDTALLYCLGVEIYLEYTLGAYTYLDTAAAFFPGKTFSRHILTACRTSFTYIAFPAHDILQYSFGIEGFML